MPDETVVRALLYDFYGELLTDKQREYYDLHYNEDLSLSEIASETGISRQGVWDIIRRAEDAMENMESKTGLVRRFTELGRVSDELAAGLESLRRARKEEQGPMIDALEEKLKELKG